MSDETHVRLGELALYIAQRCARHPYFGKTKLNKILFAADFWTYADRQESISGVTYIHMPFGPVPDNIQAVLDELVAAGRMRVDPSGHRQRLVAIDNPRLDAFSESEVRTIDEAIGYLRDFTANEASDWSHRWPGWKYTQKGEEIPYFTAMLPLESEVAPDPSPDVLEWARSLIT